MKVKIKKLNDNAVIPIRGSEEAAGNDIYACITEEAQINPHETVKIPTGFATEIPNGLVALIYSRSGMATKKGLVVCQGVGVIDSDYRGEWFIPLHNDTNNIQSVQPNERIAQVIFTDFIVPEFIETDRLLDTERGDGGFGSTGK
ncbi:MAG: dUTP diphosphatase [Lachnospiraceae bacterium]|nr:dUTP diphosphatase [Lachnospiraceae bacterium]